MLLLVGASEPLGAQRRIEVLGVSTPVVPIVSFSVEAIRVLVSLLPREGGEGATVAVAVLRLVGVGLRRPLGILLLLPSIEVALSKLLKHLKLGQWLLLHVVLCPGVAYLPCKVRSSRIIS